MASFTDSSATIAFKADDPDLHFDSSAVEGSVTFRLSDGGVISVSSDTARDDPIKDVPELAAATQRMNDLRNEVHQKLGYGEWMEVEGAQTIWVDDVLLTGADSAMRKALANHNGQDARAARDKFILEATRKRLAEIQDRLTKWFIILTYNFICESGVCDDASPRGSRDQTFHPGRCGKV